MMLSLPKSQNRMHGHGLEMHRVMGVAVGTIVRVGQLLATYDTNQLTEGFGFGAGFFNLGFKAVFSRLSQVSALSPNWAKLISLS
jgi:hypothetical protein